MPLDYIDLRSDTVTRPSSAMLKVMMQADIGDDQYCDDGATNELQQHVAHLLGMEAALWIPSGTMANQIALRLLTRPSEEVITSKESHAVWHEAGAGAANAGVQFHEIGERGVFTAQDVEDGIKPRGGTVFPTTTLIQIENTHNRAGGAVFPLHLMRETLEMARKHGLKTYLDGARLWNASIATGVHVAEMAKGFDLAMVAFSKGLGAPGGSMLAGPSDLIAEATRHRRIMGGAMRQTGFYAAPALFAIENNFSRLVEDHARARKLAEGISASEHIDLNLESVQTNMVVAKVTAAKIGVPELRKELKERGILINSLGGKSIRLLTHLDVDDADITFVSETIKTVLSELHRD